MQIVRKNPRAPCLARSSSAIPFVYDTVQGSLMGTAVTHWVGTGKEGNLCEIFYYLVDFFHGLMDMGVAHL